MAFRRPRLLANFAVTADGKVSTRCFTPTGFTSAADKDRLRTIRSLGDGLLVGAKTVAADSMSMGLSDPELQAGRMARGQTAEPVRVLLTNSGQLDVRWKVFQNDRSPLIIFSTHAMPAKIRNRMPGFCDLWMFDEPEVPLISVLDILKREYHLNSVVCEGGPRVLGALFNIGAVDDLYVTHAPRIFGGQLAPTLSGLPTEFFSAPVAFRLKEAKQIGCEFHTHFVAQRQTFRYKKLSAQRFDSIDNQQNFCE